MRVTSLFRKLLDVRNLVVKGLEFVGGDLLVDVRPLYRRRTRCGKCGRVAPRYDRQPARRWRSLGVGRTRIYLRYAPWRVSCKQCGVIVQEVPWAAGKSRFTRDFEEFVAYLAQVSTKTHTQKIAGIAWTSVEDIIRRVVARTLDEKRFDGLRNIGVDEFSYRKRHRYLTIVVDHTRRRVIWVREGKTAEELLALLTEEPSISLLVLGVAALVLWRVLRRNVRAPASPTAPGVLEDVDATADELRALAQQALDRGEAGEALIAAYRAVVASAIERTWLADRPGRTAHEAARELSTLVPTERQAVADAAAAFDAVRFGRAAASADQVRGVMELDSRLRSARPDQLALAAPW